MENDLTFANLQSLMRSRHERGNAIFGTGRCARRGIRREFGIGREAAAAAKTKGASVTLVGRTRAKLESAAQAIGGARVAVADIADRHAVQAVFDTITRVDHLVVTAGRFIAGKLNETDPDHLLAAWQERIAGPVYAIRAALPLMPATGSIVLTGGQLSDRPAAQGTSVIAAAVRGSRRWRSRSRWN